MQHNFLKDENETLFAFRLSIYKGTAFAVLELGTIKKLSSKGEDLKTPLDSGKIRKSNILKMGLSIKIALIFFPHFITHIYFIFQCITLHVHVLVHLNITPLHYWPGKCTTAEIVSKMLPSAW